jgi:hypothetical protein
MTLTDNELKMLRILNGEDVGEKMPWGAWMTATCESLKGMGLARGTYKITDEGKQYLENLEKTNG